MSLVGQLYFTGWRRALSIVASVCFLTETCAIVYTKYSFTIIVTVKDPICNVIRMRNTSLPGGVADRLPSVWMARTSSDQILPEKTAFVNFL